MLLGGGDDTSSPDPMPIPWRRMWCLPNKKTPKPNYHPQHYRKKGQYKPSPNGRFILAFTMSIIVLECTAPNGQGFKGSLLSNPA